jgi:hypothetical protein
MDGPIMRPGHGTATRSLTLRPAQLAEPHAGHRPDEGDLGVAHGVLALRLHDLKELVARDRVDLDDPARP